MKRKITQEMVSALTPGPQESANFSLPQDQTKEGKIPYNKLNFARNY